MLMMLLVTLFNHRFIVAKRGVQGEKKYAKRSRHNYCTFVKVKKGNWIKMEKGLNVS